MHRSTYSIADTPAGDTDTSSRVQASPQNGGVVVGIGTGDIEF